jgi:hypothetical protein
MRLTPEAAEAAEPANEFNDENIFVMGSTQTEVAGVDVESGSAP